MSRDTCLFRSRGGSPAPPRRRPWHGSRPWTCTPTSLARSPPAARWWRWRARWSATGCPARTTCEVAREAEAEVRSAGAVPATVAVVDGGVRVGLDDAALQAMALDGTSSRRACARSRRSSPAARRRDDRGLDRVPGRARRDRGLRHRWFRRGARLGPVGPLVLRRVGGPDDAVGKTGIVVVCARGSSRSSTSPPRWSAWRPSTSRCWVMAALMFSPASTSPPLVTGCDLAGRLPPPRWPRSYAPAEGAAWAPTARPSSWPIRSRSTSSSTWPICTIAVLTAGLAALATADGVHRARP